jgi:hypothetical protein
MTADTPAADLLAELDAHQCDICTPYNLGSGPRTRKCALAASLRILLVRVAAKHGLDVIPERLQLWVVGPSQRRWIGGRWVSTTGPNGIYWSKRDDPNEGALKGDKK